MNYEDFCHIASVCTEQIGPKCRRFFSPSNFMKFEKDESGRIAILPFYLYVMRTVSTAFWSHAFIHNSKVSEFTHLLFELFVEVNLCECWLLFIVVQVSLTQARIDMSELDEDSDGFLQPHVWLYAFILTLTFRYLVLLLLDLYECLFMAIHSYNLLYKTRIALSSFRKWRLIYVVLSLI
jgi:hypothetical protein